MKLIHRGKGFNKAKKGSSALLQSREEEIVVAVDGGAGSNSRQIMPDDVPLGTNGYGSCRDETFFESSPWLDSDCEDDFFSVNGDHTPARTFSITPNINTTPFGPHKLPTLEDILKAEPLKPPPQVKLADLLQEKQEGGNAVDLGDLSRNNSSRIGEEASQCCIPHFVRAISNKERRKHK